MQDTLFYSESCSLTERFCRQACHSVDVWNSDRFRPHPVPVVSRPVVSGGIAADDKPIIFHTCLVDQLDVKKTMQ